MSKTEIKARAGEGLSPAQEVAEAVSGFVSNFKDFQSDIDRKSTRLNSSH